MRGVAEGLAAMHRNNPPIVHRDVKDENIFLVMAEGSDDVIDVKLGDLGSAKVRRGRVVLYMVPWLHSQSMGNAFAAPSLAALTVMFCPCVSRPCPAVAALWCTTLRAMPSLEPRRLSTGF